MALASALASFAFISAGLSFVAVLLVLVVNDVLRRSASGFLELESVASRLFGVFTHPVDRAVHGILALFLFSWAITAAYLIAWQLTAGTGIVVTGLLLGLVLLVVLGLVVLPLAGAGPFGHRHGGHAPLALILVTAAYVFVLTVGAALLQA